MFEEQLMEGLYTGFVSVKLYQDIRAKDRLCKLLCMLFNRLGNTLNTTLVLAS